MKQKYLLLFGILFFLNHSYGQIVAIMDYTYSNTAIPANTIVGNVLTNDYLNNVPVNSGDVILTMLGNNTEVQLLPDGSIKTLQDFPLYSSADFQYEICDITNPNNCATSYFFLSVSPNGGSSGPAPDIDILIPATCGNPFATIQLSNFPTLPQPSWLVYVGINGQLFADTYTEGEPLIFENVPCGILGVRVEDIAVGLHSSVSGLYLPEPICDFNLTFNGIVTDVNSNGITDVGDAINYQFTVANNGTVPLTNVVVNSETLSILGGPIASLAVGSVDTTTFTAVQTLTQSMINSNVIANIAVASGTNGSDTVSDYYQNTTMLHAPDGIRLAAFFDQNNNGLMDGYESYNFHSNLGTFDYEINNDGDTHHASSVSNNLILYESNPLTTYHLSMTINPAYSARFITNTTHDITVAAGSGITTYLFPITRLPIIELNVTLNGSSCVRPGMNTVQTIRYRNYGDQSISGTITYTNDNHFAIGYTSVPVSNTPTGFNYNFNNLAPGEMRTITVTLAASAIPLINIGDQLTSTVDAVVNGPAELYPDNHNTIVQTVSNSYDPNDIWENHGPKILHSSFSSNDYLTYTIRFENTGNAEAINIKVNNLLDSQLDENSVQMVNASHNYVMDRVGNNLTWKFDQIYLKPSVSDTEIGKGYITFQVKPKPGYAIGDVIPSKADIYFDSNPAIVTNTFETEFVSTLAVNQFASDDYKVYPNPTDNFVNISAKNGTIENIQISDMLGKTVKSQSANANQIKVDFSELASGLYLLKVKSAASQKTIKIIKQ